MSPQRGGVPVTSQQDSVIDHVIKHHCTVVSAGAGSGKTYTTVAAVLELIDRGDASAEQFALITFTRAAASDLRHKIRQGLRRRLHAASRGERNRWRDQIERLAGAYVGTIHGFCSDILRVYGYDMGIARQSDVTFANSLRYDIEASVLEERTEGPVLSGRPGYLRPFELRRLVDSIYEHIRNVGICPAAVLEATRRQADDEHLAHRIEVARIISEVDRRYTEAKRAEHRMDAHDLLAWTARLLKEGEGIAQAVGARRQYLFVDEFQDTDATQKRLLDTLIPNLKRIMVVGDVKQSIYRFRGADVSLVEEIATDQGVDVLELSISRRPTRPLLRAQNALFRSVGTQYSDLDRPLDPSDATFEPNAGPKAMRWFSAGDDANREGRIQLTGDAIANVIGKRIQFEGGVEAIRPGHVVVLLRANRDVVAYAQGLRGHGFEVRSERGTRYFERPEIVSVYRLLRMIIDHPSECAMAAALDAPFLERYRSPEVSRRVLQGGHRGLCAHVADAEPDLMTAILHVRDHLRIDTVSQSLRRVSTSFGVLEHYQRRGDAEALLNLERLRDVARNVFNQEQALTTRQFVDFLQRAISTGKEQDFSSVGDDDVPPHVRVMTIHAAKGLEYPIVFLPEVKSRIISDQSPDFVVSEDVGLDVQVFPEDSGRDSRSPGFGASEPQRRIEHLGEAMRLLYVAVTRAKHSVTFIGSGSQRPQAPTSEYYSWQDEILRCREAIERAGGVYWVKTQRR